MGMALDEHNANVVSLVEQTRPGINITQGVKQTNGTKTTDSLVSNTFVLVAALIMFQFLIWLYHWNIPSLSYMTMTSNMSTGLILKM